MLAASTLPYATHVGKARCGARDAEFDANAREAQIAGNALHRVVA